MAQQIATADGGVEEMNQTITLPNGSEVAIEDTKCDGDLRVYAEGEGCPKCGERLEYLIAPEPQPQQQNERGFYLIGEICTQHGDGCDHRLPDGTVSAPPEQMHIIKKLALTVVSKVAKPFTPTKYGIGQLVSFEGNTYCVDEIEIPDSNTVFPKAVIELRWVEGDPTAIQHHRMSERLLDERRAGMVGTGVEDTNE